MKEKVYPFLKRYIETSEYQLKLKTAKILATISVDPTKITTI